MKVLVTGGDEDVFGSPSIHSERFFSPSSTVSSGMWPYFQTYRELAHQIPPISGTVTRERRRGLFLLIYYQLSSVD